MSINLGNEGIAAAKELRTSAQWTSLREALRLRAIDAMNAAIESDPAARADACGYARGLRNVWVALESATTGERQNAIPKVGSEKARG